MLLNSQVFSNSLVIIMFLLSRILINIKNVLKEVN